MNYQPHNPLIVQSDNTILLEVINPLFEEGRDLLAHFAELIRSPEHIHTYRITPLSLWNAAATGLTPNGILSDLQRLSKFPLPENLRQDVADYMDRYGRVKLIQTTNGDLLLESNDAILLTEIWHHKVVRPYLLDQQGGAIRVDPERRGHVKQAMVKIGYPVEDLAGYTPGAPLDLALKAMTHGGKSFEVRPYQAQAVSTFYKGGSIFGGSGVIVLPCGAGKTIVGMGAMTSIQEKTLILTTNITAVRQWISELLDKTTLSADQIGEYSGEIKEIRPVTVSTYQILTYRDSEHANFAHFKLFNAQEWGLIIYDEVHMLPAPVFRVTSEIQAKRRLGLTATLIREDGRQEDVFSLIGPKRFDMPWKVLERQGFIATATCHELRIGLDDSLRLQYAVAEDRTKFRIASENAAKIPLVKRLIGLHPGEMILVIGQYLDQLHAVARELNAPLITGQVPTRERDELYARFKRGDINVLVVSKVANFAVDLPDATVAIQISGTFGSRQEEAQRLGRILRPKKDGSPAFFYTIVTRDTREQDFAAKRQLFLTEQGYRYQISHAEDFFAQ